MLKTLLSSLLFLFVTLTSFSQATYPGNLRAGFGGTVGTGSITITNTTTAINFDFQRGSDHLNNVVVIYIDSKTGGFTSTSSFSDAQDDLRKAISGYNGVERATLNFPAGFEPDFAIAFDQGFGGLWELASGGNNSLNYITSVNLTPIGMASASNHTFSINKSDIDITGSGNFSFLATYLSPTAFRSNEFIGDAGPVANPGWSPYTATTFNVYANVLPVKLKSFGARKTGNSNILTWSTEEELDFKGYRIERSANGRDFTSIGFVAAEGKGKYSYSDNSSGNLVYYRLALVDMDGKINYSKIVIVKQSSSKSEIIAAFPNPVKNSLTLQAYFSQRSTVTLQVIDLNGRIIMQQNEVVEQGSNTLQINTQQLTSGIYKIQIVDKQNQQYSTTSFVKQ